MAGGAQPAFPVVLVPRGVQQDMAFQVRRRFQGRGCLQQLPGADRRQLFIEQMVRGDVPARRGGVDDRRIELVATEVHPVGDGGGEFHRYVRALGLPFHQVWQQPAHGAGGRLELQGLAPGADFFHGFVDQGEHLLDARVEVAALFGQGQASRLAQEQRVAEVALQSGDLPAHGALGDVQQFGGAGEVAALGGDQEGVQGGQGRQAFHWVSHDVNAWLV
ncbi:hypothetical protein D9M68_528310 [compost metagenome]